MTGSVLRLVDATASRFPDDPQLLERVLQPYKPHCRYLTSSSMTVRNGLASARGEFQVDSAESILDTGKLDAMEFSICYEQLVRYLIAKSIKERAVPALAGWATDDYWVRQLPEMLIVRFNSAFRSPIDSSSFGGEVDLVSFTESAVRRPVLLAETTCRFWDGRGGRADGEILLALLDSPDPRSERKVA
ncbi:MAG TPA: FcoT family thioesterase [Actinophytocola sp.]|uniref:FcoT family thioesterase n=1 Tax=Actinophytocola sp. TaxID=1872138 RepID=UPI002DDDB02A|nr:FcoT family thioesterase [Actinophytocola sp.]HEV2783515.1 FcoT family thioesterase [Actinophytocola sp.]